MRNLQNIANFDSVRTATAMSLPWNSSPFDTYTWHSSGQRTFTLVAEAKAIRAKHPDRALTIVDEHTCDLLAFAAAGKAKATVSPESGGNLFDRRFTTPVRRHDEDQGKFEDGLIFALYDYEFQANTFLVYGFLGFRHPGYEVKTYFILSAPGSKKADAEGDEGADALVEAASRWKVALRDEILVFENGNWAKDTNLYKNIQEAKWGDVILDEDKKQTLIDDVDRFFSGEATYKEYSAPWKRGLIFYGPPGNGKTISIKALMNSLSKRKDPTVVSLYVKNLLTYMGPQYGVKLIFEKAREMAPCLLVFEDVDSLVTDDVRSYFLNAIDGIESNHGIMMIGSTNHLERLDPGIAKRPSRFDRKYEFSLPTTDERIQYCQYWRNKLKIKEKIDFPEVLCSMIASITADFSFAYMKEAFVATLLSIAAKPQSDDATVTMGNNITIGKYVFVGPGSSGGSRSDTSSSTSDDDRDGAEKTLLWRVIQKQVKILREEMEKGAAAASDEKDPTGLTTQAIQLSRPVMRSMTAVATCGSGFQ